MEKISNREHIQSYFENLPAEVIELIVLFLDDQSMESLQSLNFGPRVTTAMYKATEIKHKRQMRQSWIDAHKDLGIWDPTEDKEYDKLILSGMPKIKKIEKAHSKSVMAKKMRVFF